MASAGYGSRRSCFDLFSTIPIVFTNSKEYFLMLEKMMGVIG